MGLYLIASDSFWMNPQTYLSITMMVIGLGVLIFVHELGHFLVAKACGVKCEKFYIGFDFFDIAIAGRVVVPRALFKFQWGETEYGLGIIPLGGYVKMLGQEDNPAHTADELERAKIRRPKDEMAAANEFAEADRDYELDPRSYQAKTVPQRMAIISAGVIMNLIFAVVFATIAWGTGVKEAPCEIGGLIAGGPAWQQSLPEGGRIVRIGENGRESEQLSFRRDLVQTVALNSGRSDLALKIRTLNGDVVQKEVRPSKKIYKFMGGVDIASIGISSATSTTLNMKQPVISGFPAAESEIPFEGGDTIIAVDKSPIHNVYELKKILVRRAGDDLTFTVERAGSDAAETTTIEIPVAANRMRRLGAVLKAGAIVAVQTDSPAQQAGFQNGDVLSTVNGEPVGDPFTFGQRVGKHAGESIPIEVVRKQDDGKETSVSLMVTPRLPTSIPTLGSYDPPIAIDELGIAFPVLNEVVALESNSPAEKAGLRAGDKLVRVEFVPADDAKKEYETDKIGLTHKPIDLEEEPKYWPLVDQRMQMSLPDTTVRLTYWRGGGKQTVELTPDISDQWFVAMRGFVLDAKEETHVAESWGQGLVFGLRQTGEDATRVFAFIKRLVTGDISPTNLGGPLTIGIAATSEANRGFNDFLLFLTFLSANLAVVNFLPIPVLDGGHMLFLAYEGIFRRRPNEKVFLGLTLAGFAFILCLMIFVLGLDVWRLTSFFSEG